MTCSCKLGEVGAHLESASSRTRGSQAEVEARLEVLNKEIARVRLGLRKMGVR